MKEYTEEDWMSLSEMIDKYGTDFRPTNLDFFKGKKLINRVIIDHDKVELYWDNGAYLGDAIRDVDGFFYFWSKAEGRGAWSELSLIQLGMTLEELNREWSNFIDNDPRVSKSAQKELAFELRELTGVGAMDCKAILKERNWDFKESLRYIESGEYVADLKRRGVFVDNFNRLK